MRKFEHCIRHLWDGGCDHETVLIQEDGTWMYRASDPELFDSLILTARDGGTDCTSGTEVRE